MPGCTIVAACVEPEESVLNRPAATAPGKSVVAVLANVAPSAMCPCPVSTTLG
jgi:hypothetical protein